eukprot:Gb_27639 [translate_table: standard]
MTFSVMAGEGQPLFHDFLGVSPSEPKHPEGTMSQISSKSPHSSKGFGEDLNGDSSTKASLVTSERREMTSSSPALLTRPVALAVPGFSDPGSELHTSGGLLAHGNKSAFYRPEVDSRPGGKKRESTSNSKHLLQDQLQMVVEPLETSRGLKPSRTELKDDKRGRHNDVPRALDEFHLPLQLPKPASNCPTLVQPTLQKPDFMALNRWDRPVSLNTAAYGHPYLGQFGGPERLCSIACGDNVLGTPLLSRPAADEGSHTGLQIPGLPNFISNVPSTTVERSVSAPGLLAGGSNFLSQTQGSDSTPVSHQIAAPPSRQLTVFYGGQAHVFDDVPPVKADAIMALAGSNGRSWSTTYSPRRRSCLQSSVSDDLIPALEKERTEKEETRSARTGP